GTGGGAPRSRLGSGGRAAGRAAATAAVADGPRAPRPSGGAASVPVAHPWLELRQSFGATHLTRLNKDVARGGELSRATHQIPVGGAGLTLALERRPSR